jgi:predicted RND superfamily exporter protein
MEEKLNNLPYVRVKYSLLSFLEYLHGQIVDNDQGGENLFTKPGVVGELITITSFTPGGKALLGKYLNKSSSILRISVFVDNQAGKALNETINEIISIAKSSMKEAAEVSATGFFEAYATHAAGFIRSQVVSLSFAVCLVTLVMMWQFQSVSMGLVALIPNVVPLLVIFGSMGWLGIPLDPGTSCVATVCIGLCVDDTIHYLTHVKSEMKKSLGSGDLKQCLMRAYDTSGRALISTSIVLFVPFLVLLWSPFRPVGMFGLLGAIAVISALLADLVFMPAVIMRVGFVRSILSKQLVRT